MSSKRNKEINNKQQQHQRKQQLCNRQLFDYWGISSRKHTYIILTPLLYSKTGVYWGIHYFSYFCSKNIDCG